MVGKKKRQHINLVGSRSVGKTSKGRKGGRKGAITIKPGGGRPGGRP